ncbi:alcohol dehydrogenase catalytic domain-containing protein [Bacillus sp. FSL R5-0432]|uniref:alcohol dehydrogenase catalytic domain-containing protein n=1 Tax=unclassified Bacillus (in: firmicutes) TaxID=185979 RepID=UPI000580416F|nr:alcohol dehydrogenase catalytic domain-containing protein [Bacillus sp. WP8]AIZ59174.1 hypothetical protein QR42_02330 [Bacillus sp. WP8]
MKALVIPEANSNWEIRDVPTPNILDEEVLIKIKASGLCYSDIHMSRGEWGNEFPIIPGHEPAGVIVAVGKRVNGLKIGDRVGLPWDQSGCGECPHCIQGKVEFCADRKATGVTVSGGCAEYLKAPAHYVVRIPKEINFTQAAPLFCAGYTVYGGLVHAGASAGKTVAVLGIGGLGHLGIQFAKSFGCRVIALTRGDDKVEFSKKLGAHYVINVESTDWVDKVLKLGGADVILAPTISSIHMSQAISALAPEGTLVVQGEAGNFDISTEELIAGRKRIMGSVHGPRHLLSESLEFAALHNIKPIIEEFSYRDFQKALNRLENGHIRFRAVLKFNEEEPDIL